MPKSSRVLLTLGFTLAFVLVASRRAEPAPHTILPLAAANLAEEQREGEKLASKFTAALGPLAPVALSPFFALTCLSGASLLADSGLPFTSEIKKNPIIGKNSTLNNGFVFAGLLALTLLTAAPKLTKVTKPLAQAVDQLEAHAGIISVVAIQFLSSIDRGGEAPPAAAIVFQAGIFSFTQDVLIAVFSAINIFVVNTVKFFFEVLTWLSPIPLVDAAFEAANKAFAAFLLAVYVWSPWVATILNLIIFAICLMIFAWTHRRVVYMRSVLGDPILGWLAEKIFQRPPVTPTSTHLPSSIAHQVPQRTLALKAFAAKSVGEVKRKSRGFLIQAEGRLVFAQPRLLRSPVLVPLPSPGAGITLEQGLLSNTVVLGSIPGAPAPTLIITRRYNRVLDEIRALFGAASVGDRSPVADKALAASREIGAAARAAVGRDELRTELA